MNRNEQKTDKDFPRFNTDIHHDVLQEAKRLVRLYPKTRLKKFSISDQSYWFKRLDRPRFYPLGKLLHGIISPILYPRILKSSPLRNAKKRAKDEVTKAQAFHAVGIPVSPIALATPTILISPDLGETLHEKIIEMVLKRDQRGVDELLRRAMAALGQLHANGLIHGRPHLRDMFEHESGAIGFFDFEEIPEQSMPFADAAARDLWLIAFQLAEHSSKPEFAIEALRIWAAFAPQDIPQRVAIYYRYLKGIMKLVKRVATVKSGRDLRQFIGAYDLISQAVEENPAIW